MFLSVQLQYRYIIRFFFDTSWKQMFCVIADGIIRTYLYYYLLYVSVCKNK